MIPTAANVKTTTSIVIGWLNKLPVQLPLAALIFILAGCAGREREPESKSVGTKAAVSMKAQRKVAADRRRRIIFNNDGGEATHKMTHPDAQELLDLYATGLVGTQVDSLFYCTGPSGFGVFNHFTKIGQVFTGQAGMFSNNQLPALLVKGIDPLRLQAEFAKRHGLEFFWSMRMNDTHDGSKADYGPIKFNFNQLKQSHPEYLMSTKANPPKHGAWTAVNYARPEIQDLALRYIEEVCTNYNVDGVELDFYRHPVFFKSTSRGETATDEERSAMTGLLRRIRAMADEVGKTRGHPILIAVHTPDSAEYCHAIGLDLERWMTDDLLDLWMAGGTFHLNEWEYSVALAHKHGVKVYPSLDDIRVRDDIANQMRRLDSGYRARAVNAWVAGADGIYLFNPPEHRSPPILREIGDPAILARLDRDYFGSFLGAVNSASGNLPLEPFQKTETLNGRSPKTIAPGKTATANLYVAEDLAKVGRVKLKLRLRFEPVAESRPMAVEFNTHKLKPASTDKQWLECELPVSHMQRGTNLVHVSLAPNATFPAKWTDLLLEVRH